MTKLHTRNQVSVRCVLSIKNTFYKKRDRTQSTLKLNLNLRGGNLVSEPII
ncbi:MAG TPA: hypothetical protein V6C58_15595 [Allocoleopsis sp.]